MRVFAPPNFTQRLISLYGHLRKRGYHDRIAVVYGIRKNDVVIVGDVYVSLDSKGERMTNQGMAKALDISRKTGLDIVGMAHYHGWSGGCRYLSSTDMGTISLMFSGFLAFVVSPDCVAAWYHKDRGFATAEIIEMGFKQYDDVGNITAIEEKDLGKGAISETYITGPIDIRRLVILCCPEAAHLIYGINPKSQRPQRYKSHIITLLGRLMRRTR